MHLSSITLKGFKSFPDRTRLTFAPGVSVIVGPNGSGKSNITDAVLWAMGEQSPVAVRGASMQDVIFAGAHGVQARSEAEVEVVLDNASGGLDLPVGEVAITRRLNRAGEGEYRINGAKCRLSDVIEILSDTGLGKEMHSVVSQGRVAEIVTSKPRDRRMLIEEAAGLGKHRKRRRRAQLKLERTQDNLDRALDVEREARTRLKPLKRQAEAAELHARIERQMDEARWTLARDGARVARAALGGRRGGRRRRPRRGRRDRVRADRGRQAPRSGRGGALRALVGARDAVVALLLGPFLGRADRDAAGRRPARRGRAGRARRPPPQLDRAPGGRSRGRHGRRRRVRAHRRAAGRARRPGRGLQGAPGARAGRAGGTPRGRHRAGRRAGGRGRRRGRAPVRRRGRRPRRPGRPAASWTRRPRPPAASPPASAPSSPRPTSSCAPTPAPRAARTALADLLAAAPGYELALTAALGPRMRAAVAADLEAGAALLSKAGKDGAAALIVPAQPRRRRAAPPPPRPTAAVTSPAASHAARGLPRPLRPRPAPSRSPPTSRPPATTPPNASPPSSSTTCGSSSPSTGSIPPSPASP